MTDAVKIANYDRVVQIIENHLALEKHLIERDKAPSHIQFIRADAYEHIVEVIKGHLLP